MNTTVRIWVALTVTLILVGCSLQDLNIRLIRQKVNTIPIPPDSVLLDSRQGTESQHPDSRCWVSYNKRVYASDTLSFEEVLRWYKDKIDSREWNGPVWYSDRLLAFGSSEKVELSVSDEYRFVVFPNINTREEELRHKTLFLVELSRRADTAMTAEACT